MQEDKVKMVEIKIYLDLKITKMHSKIVAGFYSSHLLVFVRLAKLYRCRVFFFHRKQAFVLQKLCDMCLPSPRQHFGSRALDTYREIY